MIQRDRPAPCYRDRDNGVRFIKSGHRIDCTDPDCRGCTPCPEPHHCAGKKNCTWHVPEGVLVCGRCIGAARRELRLIVALNQLLIVQAMADGVDSEAANLAGPGSDWETFAARRRLDRNWIERHLPEAARARAIGNLIEVDDEHHPHTVLTRWQTRIATAYHHACPTRPGVVDAADYLERQLGRVANDPDRGFNQLKADLKKCRQHIESVLHNDDRLDQGVPCPSCRSAHQPTCTNDACTGCVIVRLERHYAHYCDRDNCDRIHFVDEWSDVWMCPRNRDHWWTQRGYAELVAARRGAIQ